MLRSFLVLLLLAHYLLMVGAGLLVERPDAPAFSGLHPYVHSKLCQQRNYLRLDCFEQCDGHQQEVKAKLPIGGGRHFLAQLKGVDVHCTAAPVEYPLPLAWHAVGAEMPTEAAAHEAAGFGGRDYPPPRRG
ncbi:hypothetical protein [Hymenobacter terrenus]|uniref:hypothetical protein n=1 Tax=Hymenobacter terrenus TaxID=1629124 RepID=UPI0006196394|nr:hypothetical protein [Hymenobacter terrenus]